MTKGRVVISLNATWNLVNFRAGLIRALVLEGYEVIAVAPRDEYVDRLLALGVRYVSITMDSKGRNPISDFFLWVRYLTILYREKPDVYLGYTIKPNIYGSLAAHALSIPVVNNIAGLGVVFGGRGVFVRFVKRLYQLALSRSSCVFFQNEDDRKLFSREGLVQPELTDRVPGSGVDLSKFKPEPVPDAPPFRFLLVARMLWDKGVREFVEAARIVRGKFPDVEFCLLGFLDVKNPGAISRAQMASWVDEGVVRYLGVSDDVRVELRSANCVVLPSYYREGVPRTLLEAAALGRPIITTDAVGCREVVDDGVNGYLCRPKDGAHLAEVMMQLMRLGQEQIAEMGMRSREKVEREFDEKYVIHKYIRTLEGILNGGAV